MKKIIFIALSIVGCLNIQSQNSFGVITYPKANAFLSSGRATSVGNPGFLVSSYVPVAAPGTPNFSVDRLDIGGLPGALPTYFQNNYQIDNFNVSCTPTGQIVNTYGSTAIELTGNPGGCSYAVVAATDQGLAYSALLSTGVANIPVGHPFPTVAIPSARPLLCQNQVVNTEGIIAVGASGNLYINRITLSSGALIVGIAIQIPGAFLVPTGVLYEPYSGSNLVTIVGYKATASTQQNGFLLQLNPTSLAVVNFLEYDQTIGGNSNNTFQCITLDNSGPGGPGFLVGGNGESLLGNPGKAWMLKLGATGNVIWSSVIDGTINANSGKIHAVFQRYSAAYGRYENYGLCAANAGMTVYRLDKNGLPLTGINDEFLYNTGSSTNTWPVDISFKNTGSSSDEGMQLYGNMDMTPGNPYFVEAYFSGETGCEIITAINQVDNSGLTPSNVMYSTTAALGGPCPISITDVSFAGFSPICGPVSSIGSGSNLKQATGISEVSKNANLISVFPNPISNELQISSRNSETLLQVEFYNILMEKVYKKDFSGQTQIERLELVDLNLKNGTYFLKINTVNAAYTIKIIIQN